MDELVYRPQPTRETKEKMEIKESILRDTDIIKETKYLLVLSVIHHVH